MKKSCTVNKSGKIGFRIVEGGPVIKVLTSARPGSPVEVDLDKVTLIEGSEYSREYEGTVTIYGKATFAPGALSYGEVVEVAGKPPRIWGAVVESEDSDA